MADPDADLEGDRVFHQVLLNSLDPEDDEYEDQKAFYEGKIQDLERQLATRALSNSDDVSSSLASPETNSRALPRKRQRKPSESDARHAKRPNVSDASDPLDSLSESDNEADDALNASSGGLFDVYSDHMVQRQREQEQRWRQQKEDEELARRLSTMEDEPTQTSSSAAYPQPLAHTQTYFGQNGHVQRPRLPEPSPPRSMTLPYSPGRHEQSDAYHAPAQQWLHDRRLPPPSFSAPVGPNHRRDHDFNDSSSDEAHNFMRASDRERLLPLDRAPAVPTVPQSFGPPMPGAYPSLDSDLGMGGTHRYGMYASGGPGDYQGVPGSSVYGGPPLGSYATGYRPGSHRPMFGADDYSEEQLENLRNRGMFSLLYDPSRSKDEIMKLLETIRPDEEIPPAQRLNAPPELSCVLMEHQKLGLAWLKQQEEGSHKGSILADDMGLGKTIQALALILARKPNDVAVKTTLIVAPVALLKQWQKEIKNKVIASKRLRVFVHESGINKLTFNHLSQFDVVLTTYGMLVHEWKRKQEWFLKQRVGGRRTPVGEFSLLGDECIWFRVILDEAQAIKNRQTKASAAAAHLRANYRLCMTGTPMMNNVDEFYSLIRFLRIPPYNVWEKFNKDLARPLASRSSTESVHNSAMDRLRAVIKAVMLRRTKTSTVDGKPILSLPPRVIETQHAVFNEDQRAYYQALETHSKSRFNSYLKAGTVNKNYTNALVLLLRLRQVCDHPHLIQDHAEEAEAVVDEDEQEQIAALFNDEVVAMIRRADGAFECPICYDASENPTIFFPCGHDVCAECFTRLSDPSAAATGDEAVRNVRCPECRESINVKQIISYNVFKRIRLPDLCKEEDLVKAPKDEPESESDSDDDTEDEDSDVDDNGDLRGFVVRDDEEEIVAEGEEGYELATPAEIIKKDEDSDEKDDVKHRERRRRRRGAHGKVFGKSQKSERTDGEKGHGSRPKRKKKKKQTMAELKKAAGTSEAAKKKYLRRLRKNFVSSAKIDKTLEILDKIRQRDASEKTIVFSQFTTFLDLVEVSLSERAWKSVRYDGSMSAAKRNAAVERFQEKEDHNIMLVSLKAGNAGLNLNWASQVIILDPFWNPFVEEQAIDRAHRIGQRRQVTVHRMLVPETVEDRIVLLQEQKRKLINAALDEKAGKSMGRLGVQQLAYLFGLGGAAPPTDATTGTGGPGG